MLAGIKDNPGGAARSSRYAGIARQRARHQQRRRNGNRRRASKAARRGAHRFNFANTFDGQANDSAATGGTRNHSLTQIRGSAPARIVRMDRHPTHQTVTAANKNRCGRPPIAESSESKSAGHPEQAINRREPPSAKVVRHPAPRLEADPGPAEASYENPLAIEEWGPPITDTRGAPAIAITRLGEPIAVGVQIGKARGIVARSHVSIGVVRGRKSR